MSARTDDLELNAPFHQSTPSVATSSSAGSSTKRAKEKLAQHLKGIVSDDPFGDITFSDDEDNEEDNFAIEKVLKMTKNKVRDPQMTRPDPSKGFSSSHLLL
jgi:hypothetical protein